MHRSGYSAGRRFPDPPGDRTPGCRIQVVRRSWFDEVTHPRSIQVGLVNCLRCAAAPQFRGPVGGDRNERDSRGISLDHRRIKVGAGSAAAAQNECRSASSPPMAERCKGGGTFVVEDMGGNARVCNQRKRQRGRSGSWGDESRGEAIDTQLVTHCCAVCRVRR